MFLKSIEVQGFKSFANKIVFQFHNGITGIVGPNGSGKSNVADAVRWVLGEQSVKQLRGGTMQDVIFSGTETRKPLSYAYVAITLDNADHALPTDFEEVTIARRLYRSGESEYLLNGTPCRLKDVNELFYDTGIGKEGYSIIGQGQIDRILSGKPEERRELFDEAAGIVKFKRRKTSALKKLENEQNNLVRVNDILAELERQVGPLERQSEKAKQYLSYKDTLKTLDVNAFLLEHESLKNKLIDAEEKLSLAGGDLADVKEKYDGVKEEYDRMQEEISGLDKEIEDARNELSNTDLNRSRLEGQIELLKEKIRSAGDSDAYYLDRQNAINEEIKERKAEREKIINDNKDADEQAAETEKTAKELSDALAAVQSEIEELNKQIEEGKNTIIGELNSRSTIKAKMSRFDSLNEQINVRKAELNSRILRVKSDEEERKESIKALETAFEEATNEISAKQKSEKEVEAEIEELRSNINKTDDKLRQDQNTYHQEKTRLQTLLDIAERYEGYGGSVKKVMEQKDRFKGIVGVVADIIKVDKKYETAIETALGGNIQNIVTKDEETAKKLIGFLKEGKLGRATFLPMDAVTNPQQIKAIDVLNEKGVLGLAHTLVDTDKAYEKIAESLLGRFVVVDTVDNATKIARKYNYTIRMVTLEGELLAPGGAISGGSFKNNTNFLGKRREISDLEKSVAKLEKDIESGDKLVNELRDKRTEKRTELEHIKLEISDLTIKQNTARINLSSARERMEEETENALNLSQEQQSIEAQLSEIIEGRESAKDELAASEELEKITQEKVNELNKILEDKHKEETEAAAKVNAWEVEVSKMRQAIGFKQANLDRIDSELAKSEEELAAVVNALNSNAEMVKENKENIALIEETIEKSYSVAESQQTKMQENLKKKAELSAKQKTFFEDREALSERMASLDKEVFRLNAQKEKCEESIESHINYMWDEYEITLSAAANIRDESMTDLVVMKRDIAEVKDKIKRLGDVNVNAIEEYKEISERYNTMKTQQTDLVQAAETLKDIIAELDSAMRKQFTEKFKEISEEYDRVFKELFGGGKGTLELMEEEDILEAGIKIIAQPPGKKLQNMMQLSGGEKALSAIALMFAIQNLKPSPFCLLDEIEAALDDSNVGRFAKYLHKLTKHTQFIVITHRRGTMENVDRLYGITMQEKGVSTLVSVNLIEKDLDA
ncbi:MAG: chromosome segregation protein SMC [Lachnospiraceae bacterium]|nr:chromosome segregation protein SMC [Lachnospiraceae bacterium]